jgi:hypothetical protein
MRSDCLSSRRAVTLGLALALIAGCGGQAIVPVEGTVTLDGKPLAGANIVLAQLRATAPGPFVGKTDADGKFSLGATDGGSGGAAPGEYRLMITTVTGGSMEDSPLPTEKEVVPADYHSGTIKFTVPAEGTNEANFDLKSLKSK